MQSGNAVCLKDPVTKTQRHEVNIVSFDQCPPNIKQIENSIEDIEDYVHKDTLVVYPPRICQHHYEICLFKRLEELSDRGLAYVSNNLSVSANIETATRSDDVVLDIFLLLEGHPPSVISIVGREACQDSTGFRQRAAQQYNLSLTKGLIQGVRNFTSEQFSAVFGVLTERELETEKEFKVALLNIRKRTSGLCVAGSLSLMEVKRKNLIRAFLLSVSVTASVSTVEEDYSLWILTLEQFRVLTENIDKRHVTVRTTPSTGGKVLMREVARRLERSGPTVLITETEEQTQRARMELCSFMMTLDTWKRRLADGGQVGGIKNIVTNCLDCPLLDNCDRSWIFVSDGVKTPSQQSEAMDRGLERQTFAQDSGNVTDMPNEDVTKTMHVLEKDLQRLKTENEALRKTEDDLTRMLESVSLGGFSLDSNRSRYFKSGSGVGSVRSLDRLAESDKQSRSYHALKSVKKRLTVGFGRRKARLDPTYLLEKDAVYVMTDALNRHPLYVICRQHDMDNDRMNKYYGRVSMHGQPATSQEARFYMLHKGACVTQRVTLTPPPPTPASLSSHYWETHTVVEAREPYRLLGVPLLEMGVSEESHVLNSSWVYQQPGSWSIRVVFCDTHRGICTQVWEDGERIACYPGTMSDAAGARATLRYGLVVDGNGRIGCIDLDRHIVLYKLDTPIRNVFYPVFGVSISPCVTIKMRMLSGSGIIVTEEKQSLIYSALRETENRR
ncbi:uncharacterized protein LOC124145963 isoform X2 [Haliotis rufescens]|uniref:uncharacterized protein LOC124145963 isoform X2 n=1 Tax=Haliotis rufescens TaxID=6454 RepID=UPI00201EB26B|nr:uncharacterized protein LOC124145963 isoform X2 [Haliotis rufescens]